MSDWIDDADAEISEKRCERGEMIAIIQRHHERSCPQVTLEKSLAQVEVIAESIRERVTRCDGCALMREREKLAIQERDEALECCKEFVKELDQLRDKVDQYLDSGLKAVQERDALQRELDKARAKIERLNAAIDDLEKASKNYLGQLPA